MTTETYIANNLLADNVAVVEKTVTVVQGEQSAGETDIVRAGTLLTQVTEAGATQYKHRVFNAANTDGTEIIQSDPVICAYDVSTTTAVPVNAYSAGVFNREKILAETGVTLDVEEIGTLRKAGIFLATVW